MRGRLLAVASLAVLLLAGCTPDDASTTPDDVEGQNYQSGDGSTTTWKAADRSGPLELSGTDFAGTAQDVADWRGEVVVLNTWYAECPPCRAEAPDLVALATDYADDGVRVLGINRQDDAGTAQAFERTFEVPYPSIADGDGSAIAALQGTVPVNAVPTTIVLDRSGKVAGRILGLADPSTLRSMVDALVDEAPAS